MNIKKIIYLILTINLIMLNVGCLEKTNDKLYFDNIILESNVVELVNASMNFKYDKTNTITRVEVIYLFKNIANYIIKKLNITVEFFDTENNLIAISETKYIRNMPVNYVETSVMEANIITYENSDSNLIDHCRIIAIEE